MKKIFVLSMLISFGMISSCQKQDSTAEQQLAQRKVELDAREEALAERKSVLDEREKALDEREKVIANVRTIPTGVQGQPPQPPQVNAERDMRMQQLPLQPQARIRTLDPEKDRLTQERAAQSQRGPEEIQRQRQRKLELSQRWRMSGGAVSPAAEATSSPPLPAIEATSPTPSPTP